jgi:hypothetical protein
MGTLKTTNIQSISGSGTVTLGTSGETFTLGAGVTASNFGKILQVQTKVLTTTVQQTAASTTTFITSDDFTLSSTNSYVLAVLAFNYDLQGYSATTTPTGFLTLTDTAGTIQAKQQVKDRIAVNSEGHDSSGCMIAYFQEGSVSSRKVYAKYGSDGSGQLRIYGNSSFTNATRLMIFEIGA